MNPIEYNKDQLLNHYINAQLNLGKLVSKYLSVGWNIELNDLRVARNRATVKFNDEWLDIMFTEDNDRNSRELLLCFYSDDIPDLHEPIRMLCSDDSVLRKAFYDMVRSYEEYIYFDDSDGE